MQISWGQTLVILLLVRLFTLLTYAPITSDGNTFSVYMTAAAISMLIQAFFVIPIIYLKSKYKDKSIIDIAKQKGVFCKYLVSVLYFIFIACVGIASVVRFERFIDGVFFESRVNIIISAGILIIATIYGAYCGIQGIARSAAFIFAFLVLYLIIQVFNLSGSVNLDNLTPQYDMINGNLATAIFYDMYQSSEIVLIAILLPYFKDTRKGVYGYICGKLITVEIILFLVVTVLGGYSKLVDYPSYSLAAHTVKSTIARLDAFYILLWVMISFIAISLIILSMSDILKSVFSKVKYSNIISGALILLGSIPIFYNIKIYNNIVQSCIGVVPMIVLIVIIPSILLLMKGKRT